jgi:prephenate dehydrogenase
MNQSMRLKQLTIYGAGLIGGSVAHAARAELLADRLVAIDVEQPPAVLAPFDAWVMASDEEGIRKELAQSDLTLLCAPVRVIAKLLPRVLELSPGWVTDCGSTKEAITRTVAGLPGRERFVAGHPMAGHPEGGLRNARADLFRERKWILCPEGSSQEAESVVTMFVQALGAEVVRLDARRHDRSVAVTSHIPQVVASALSVIADEIDAKQAAGPGFASSTRVAGGAESMWRDIFETNAQSIGVALTDLGTQLQKLGEELKQSKVEGALLVLEQARKLRDKS